VGVLHANTHWRLYQSKQDAAPTAVVWGTGTPRRQFLFVDDLADACVFVLEHYTGELHLNVGSGQEVTIADFAKLVTDIVDFEGKLVSDRWPRDGTPRKQARANRESFQFTHRTGASYP
jgi:GDP-L-fucose synthase